MAPATQPAMAPATQPASGSGGLSGGSAADMWARIPKWEGGWRAIPGWPHDAYKTGGLVRSASRILTQRNSNRPIDGPPFYQLIDLCAGGVKKTVTVHSAVCSAWHGERPPGMVVRHLGDGIPNENSAVKLAWGTPPENEHDKPEAVRVATARTARAARTDIPVYHGAWGKWRRWFRNAPWPKRGR